MCKKFVNVEFLRGCRIFVKWKCDSNKNAQNVVVVGIVADSKVKVSHFLSCFVVGAKVSKTPI